MNVKSLIETITSAITTTGLARYVINDRSFLAELLSDRRPTPSGPQTDAEVLGIKPFIDYRPTDRLPVTMLVVRMVWKTLMLLPWLCYRGAAVAAALMSGARVKRLADCPSKVRSARVNFVIFFGSLLYQIRASNEPLLYDSDRDADHRRMIQGNHDRGRVFSFEARHSGDLYVSVNDIYLDRRVLDIMDSCRNTAVVTSLLERYGPAMTNGQKIAMLRAGLGRKYLPEMWFADNMGEILFNITVHRNVIREANTAESFFAHVYRHIDRFFDQRPGAILLQVAVALAVIVLLLWADNRFMHRSPNE